MAALLAASAPAGAASPASAAVSAQGVVSVVAGVDRYATAVAVSRAAFPEDAQAVVIASGEGYADALSGSGLAGAVGGPLLLSAAGTLPPAVAAEIARLGAMRAYVLGGEGALSAHVASEVAAALLPGGTVVRLAGEDRYGTAEAVARATIDAGGAAWDGGAFFVDGSGFADGVSAGAVAARTGRPVLLVPSGGVTTGTLDLVRSAGVTDAVIVGGTASVRPTAFDAIAEAAGGAGQASRVSGTDRYATALAVAAYSERFGLRWVRPGVVSGVVYPDALVAGVLQARTGGVLLLTRPSELDWRVGQALWDHRAAPVAGITVVGGSGAVQPKVRLALAHALLAPPYDNARAMAHVTAIAGLGPRAAGGTAEHRAFDYIADRLREYGFAVTVQTVFIPGGRTSHNVIAERAGTSADVVVLGAHVDSKYPSPGANDNASGVAVVLETARVMAQAQPAPTVRFIAFGAEEISGATADDHHFGSRQYVASLSAAERSRIAAAVSVDMVGYGTVFNVRSMQVGPATAVQSLQRWGTATGQALPFLKDPGLYGWSDHEGFERVSIPAAWLEWREDPVYHTSRDTAAHVQPSRVDACGRLVRGWVLDLDAAKLDAMH